MARPSGWDVLGLDGDPTPGVVESVEALAKEFGDFAHDVESAYRSLNSFGSDANALQWVGQTAEAFKGQFGPLPGRLQKLYTSYSEASDALSAYAPLLRAAQSKADSALRQAQDAQVDLQRATTNANTAATDLKTAQQNHAANPNQQAVTDAQTAHDTAQTSLDNAKSRMADLTRQAHDAYNDRINAAKTCATALHRAQSDGIHNKHWWEHVGEFLSEWGGKIAEIANDLAPFLDVLALATSWIPGVDVITAGLAEADNLIALAGTGLQIAGDAMQGHWGDALMGAGMLGVTFLGGKAVEKYGGKLLEKLGSRGNKLAKCATDPVDVVSGWMLAEATDVELPGVLPVILRRAYCSAYAAGRLFGAGWTSTRDQRLSINATGIHFAGDDAQILDYPVPDGDQEVLPENGGRWPLVWNRETDEIRLRDPWSGLTRHFTTTHYQGESGQIRDLVAITDRNGNRISIRRDEHGTPVAVEHPAYEVLVDTVATAAGQRITGLRLKDGTERGVVLKEYRYDDRGRLTGIVDSSGTPFRYEWDGDDRITAWIDRVGYRYRYEYDESGRVVSTGGDAGFMAGAFAYDRENQTTTFTDSLGCSTTYRYDENGHVCSETDPLGNVTATVSDRYGRQLSRTDPLGATTLFEYDAAGDVRRIIAADGAVTTLGYNDHHGITAIAGTDGATWRREYDDAGNLTAVIDPVGAVTRFENDAHGALTAVTDPLGVTTRYSCDAAGLAVSVVDQEGAAIRARRDVAGRLVRITDRVGAVTTLEWSIEGRLVSRTGPDGATNRWEYDPEGRLLRTVDPVGAVTTFEPGPFDTITARTGPDGVRHSFTYDTEQRLLQVANPAGATWNYTYDAAGRLVGETDFNGRHLHYAYDPAGGLTARTMESGARITLAYDIVGRLVTRSTPEGEYGYSYDAAGRVATIEGPDSSLHYERDVLGRVLAETVDGRTTRHTYDAAGRRTSRTTATGAESVWTFDAAGRPAALAAGTGRVDFRFDAAGREIERHFGPDVRLTSGYDPAGRLAGQDLVTGSRSVDGGTAAIAATAAATDPVLSRSWVWRADGVPEEIRDSLRGTRRITSDAVGRVTAVTAQGWRETYAYDTFGNLAGAGAEPAMGDVAEPTLANRTQVQQAGRTNHEYDSAGRVVRSVRRTLDGRRKTWHYTWDTQDRLIQAETPDHGTWHYRYDPAGRRSAKLRVDADGSVTDHTRFTWDGPRLAEQTTTNHDGSVTTLTWDYDPGTFRPTAQRRRVWATDAGQDSIDEAFHAIVTDLIGSPTELVTPDGRIAWHTTTTLWGHTTATGADPGLDCPLRFPGQYHDAETGLHYNLHRYYNPDTGAYLTPDPLGLAPAPNDHAYVPNPLTWTDPLGLKCGEEPVKLYRSPQRGNRASEERGLDPANHTDLDPQGRSYAYLGESESVARKYAGQGVYEDGYHVFTMKPGFLDEFHPSVYRRFHDDEGGLQWIIDVEDIDLFNSFIDHSKTEWVPWKHGVHF